MYKTECPKCGHDVLRVSGKAEFSDVVLEQDGFETPDAENTYDEIVSCGQCGFTAPLLTMDTDYVEPKPVCVTGGVQIAKVLSYHYERGEVLTLHVELADNPKSTRTVLAAKVWQKRNGDLEKMIDQCPMAAEPETSY